MVLFALFEELKSMCRSLAEGREGLRVADILKQQCAVATGSCVSFCVFFLLSFHWGRNSPIYKTLRGLGHGMWKRPLTCSGGRLVWNPAVNCLM